MTVLDEKQEFARRQQAQAQSDAQVQQQAGSHEQTSAAAPGTLNATENPDELAANGFIVPDMETPSEAPPAYGDSVDKVLLSQPGFEAGASVTGDGRVNININTKNRRLADLLAPVIDRQASVVESQRTLPPAYIPPSLGGQPGQTPPPKLNIVIQIVGSRGDVQPFVALGKTLRDTYGHRVRIATHATFQAFVEENGLEFFNIGGDPAELMAFMVKNPGLMPGFDALKSGEVSKRRKGIEQILAGCWRSCIEAGNGLGPPPAPHSRNAPPDYTQGMSGNSPELPFVADAIIANPPSFAHIHVAEKLGIPLHMMFTMPWTPTQAFQHPLANIQSTTLDDTLTNNLSYTLVEIMTWQGLGDVINRFREKVLELPPLSPLWAPGLLTRLKISYTYCWSPALIPKPNDWGNNIFIAGFYFLDLASSYTPDAELDAFLNAGPPPVYIGFGSIVVDDPNAMTRMIFDAVRLAGVRALVSKGWGGLGADDVGLPEGVFMLGNVPHDWLFQHVSAVVHHGGAGTSAAGIKAGKPTFVVPFFGDQPFWGAMIARANAGPEPVSYKDLTAEKLAKAIKKCIEPETIEQAKALGQKIRQEKGTDEGGISFHRHLDADQLRCSVVPSRAAAWRVRRTKIQLSPLAAAVLVRDGTIKYTDLKLYRPREYNTEDQPTDPLSAGAAALLLSLGTIGMAISDIPRDIWKSNQSSKQISAEKASDEVSMSKQTEGSDSKTAETPEASMSQSQQQQSIPTRSDPALNSGGMSSGGAFNIEGAVDTAKGVNRIVGAGIKSPMNFCLGLAKGFRNMPRLYNDETVRPVEKVTNLSSGIKVAGKELGYGFFDGISGLVTQPLQGAEKDGAAGLIKGFGKGIGGLVLKPAAGIWGFPGYAMQGVNAEINKLFSRSVYNYILSSRIRQGELDLQNSSAGERKDVSRRWDAIKSDLSGFNDMKRKERGTKHGKNSTDAMDDGASRPRTSWFRARQLASEKGRRMQKDKASSALAASPEQVDPAREEDEVERAIQASVRGTSKGSAEEDAQVDAAIRESLRSMRQNGALPTTGWWTEEKNRRGNASIFEDDEFRITDEEYQDLIQLATQRSMAEHCGHADVAGPSYRTSSAVGGQDDTGSDLFGEGKKTMDDDRDLERAMAESREEMQRAATQQTEEDIVLEYIKKQSLAEEEFGRQTGKGKGVGGDEDEELKRAMDESLMMSHGS